jgi:predicted dehydrogenase
MEQVRICLVGAGRAGEVHGDVCFFSVPGAIITSVFDTDIAKAKNLAQKYKLEDKYAFVSFEDALSYDNFDAVIITTPTFTHCQYTEMAARKKIHVFSEKPMAITLEDCDRMIDVCTKEKVLLQIGFMRRFDAGFLSAKQMIENGDIGDPLVVKSVGRGPGLPGKWAYDIKTALEILQK